MDDPDDAQLTKAQGHRKAQQQASSPSVNPDITKDSETDIGTNAEKNTETGRSLSPAAKRALAEAELRRRQGKTALGQSEPARELNGRGGLDPARYGDWEVKGLTSDF